MGESTKSLEESLQKQLAFIDIIKSNGYSLFNGEFPLISFEKQVSKKDNGSNDTFYISIHPQASGHVSASLVYIKKVKESADNLRIEQYLSNLAEVLDKRIKQCEEKCLLTGINFN